MAARAFLGIAWVSKFVDRVVYGLALVIIDLHLEHEVAIFDVGVVSEEERAVLVEGPTIAQAPAIEIELIEVVSPSKLELVATFPVIDFNPIVASVPGHGRIVVHVVTPNWKLWRPEIHEERLSL